MRGAERLRAQIMRKMRSAAQIMRRVLRNAKRTQIMRKMRSAERLRAQIMRKMRSAERLRPQINAKCVMRNACVPNSS